MRGAARGTRGGRAQTTLEAAGFRASLALVAMRSPDPRPSALLRSSSSARTPRGHPRPAAVSRTPSRVPVLPTSWSPRTPRRGTSRWARPPRAGLGVPGARWWPWTRNRPRARGGEPRARPPPRLSALLGVQDRGGDRRPLRGRHHPRHRPRLQQELLDVAGPRTDQPAARPRGVVQPVLRVGGRGARLREGAALRPPPRPRGAVRDQPHRRDGRPRPRLRARHRSRHLSSHAAGIETSAVQIAVLLSADHQRRDRVPAPGGRTRGLHPQGALAAARGHAARRPERGVRGAVNEGSATARSIPTWWWRARRGRARASAGSRRTPRPTSPSWSWSCSCRAAAATALRPSPAASTGSCSAAAAVDHRGR